MRVMELPLLQAAEESVLARQIEAGVLAGAVLGGEWGRPGYAPEDLRQVVDRGRQAWEHFLLANVRLVWSVVRRWSGRSRLSDDELFQEGFVALALAVQAFDHTRARFSTFALPRLQAHVAAQAVGGMLHLPGSRVREIRRVRAVTERLAGEQSATPALADVAHAIGRRPEWVAGVLAHAPAAPLEEVSSMAWAVGSDPGERLEQAVMRRHLVHLPVEVRHVICWRFGFIDGTVHTYREIAQWVGVSPSTVRRLERTGVASLRRVCEPLELTG